MNFNEAEQLNSKQRKEFALVELTQRRIKQKLIVRGFDDSIDVKLKLQPKFSLHSIEEKKSSKDILVKPQLVTPKKSKSKEGLVSVVVTVYNRADYLAATIDSILAQTYTDFELIIRDDGSTDESLEIANNYAQQDNRIKVFSADNEGQGKPAFLTN